MDLLGMVVSGCGFVLIGLWHACISFARKPASPSSKPPPLFSSAQLVSIAALSFLHFVSGLVASHRDKTLLDGVASAVPLERSTVALVVFIFAITNLLSLHTHVLPLPHEMLCLIALFALGQEFLLFYLQRPDAGLESRYYTLLLVPICACMSAVASSIAFPKSPLASLGLAGGLFLQGTWLLQMGLSFFTSAFMAKGCALQKHGEGDYVIKCDGDDMALMRGKAVATLQFNCHMALLVILMLPLYAVTKRHSGLSNPYDLNYEMVTTVEAHGSKRYGDVVQPSPSAFSLGLDEDLDDDKSPFEEQNRDANGFHRVVR